MHALLEWLLDCSTPERSNKEPKIKLKGGQRDKIGNIEKNNTVGVHKLLQYVT
jgi:hypothetical protein